METVALVPRLRGGTSQQTLFYHLNSYRGQILIRSKTTSPPTRRRELDKDDLEDKDTRLRTQMGEGRTRRY